MTLTIWSQPLQNKSLALSWPDWHFEPRSVHSKATQSDRCHKWHAGSENQKTSGAMGEQFKESIKINKSLSTLGLVISRLAHTTRSCAEHVPYRDSRLTWLLKVHCCFAFAHMHTAHSHRPSLPVCATVTFMCPRTPSPTCPLHNTCLGCSGITLCVGASHTGCNPGQASSPSQLGLGGTQRRAAEICYLLHIVVAVMCPRTLLLCLFPYANAVAGSRLYFRKWASPDIGDIILNT